MPSEPNPVGSGQGELIVVVEADEAVRGIATRTLVEAGYRVLEAETGAEAIDLLSRGEPPALVLADVVTPGPRGSDLGEQIHRVAPGVPLLFMSGYTNGEIVRRGMLDPEADLVAKPFLPAELVQAVQARMARAPQRASPVGRWPGAAE